MLMFKGQPDGRVERRLHKNSLVKDKKVFVICNLRYVTVSQSWKIDQWGLEEVFLFCIEEGHDNRDGWCINAQNWYCKE